MPIVRYFVCVGGVLLALLLVIGRSFPDNPEPGANNKADDKAYIEKPQIRIAAIHKDGPDAVVIDTTLPTIVPPSIPYAVAAGPAHPEVPASSPRDAFAKMETRDVQAEKRHVALAEVKPVRKHKAKPVRVASMRRHPANTMVAIQQPFFFGSW